MKNTSTSSPANLLVSLTEQNLSTGNVEWGWTDTLLFLDANKSFSQGTLDNDYTPLATSYLVTLTVKDARSGAVVATRSATVTTGKLRVA